MNKNSEILSNGREKLRKNAICIFHLPQQGAEWDLLNMKTNKL